MNQRQLKLILILSCSTISAQARAQSADAGQTVDKDRAGKDQSDIIVTGGLLEFRDPTLIQSQAAPKQVDTITAAYIQRTSPANNPVQLLKITPGANVATSDPYGITNANVTVRGLNQDEIGFLQNGVPIKDTATQQVFINGYADTENIRSIELQSGSPDVSTPEIGAVGGLVTISYRDPTVSPEAVVKYTHGSFDMNKIFARIDTGEIGNTGIRAFASYSYLHTDTWRGPGYSSRQHADLSVVKDLPSDGSLRLNVSFNRLFGGNPYRNPTLAQFQALGNSFNFDAAYTGTNTTYWRFQTNPFDNFLVSTPLVLHPSDGLTISMTPYFLLTYGGSRGAALLRESPAAGGNGFYDGTTGYKLDLNGNGTTTDSVMTYDPFYSNLKKFGSNNQVVLERGSNRFTLGYWGEYDAYRAYQRFQIVNADGTVPDYQMHSNLITVPSGRYLAAQDNLTHTAINAIYGGDTISLLRKLTVDLSLRQVWITLNGINYLPGSTPRTVLSVTSTEPRIAIRFSPSEVSQFYASGTATTRISLASALFQAYSVNTGALITAPNTGLKPERSISFEAGYRYTGSLFRGNVTVFHYDLRNQQVTTNVIQNGAQVSSAINAGGLRGQGVDVELALRSFHGFSPFVSGEYLGTRRKDNLQVGSDFLPTRGKDGVRAPHFQASAGIAYASGGLFGNVSGKYIGNSYSTFMNDQAIKEHAQVDLAAGYRFERFGFVRGLELRLNVINLTNGSYLTGVNTVTANALPTTGINGTTIAGSNPNYYTETPRAVTGTISVPF